MSEVEEKKKRITSASKSKLPEVSTIADDELQGKAIRLLREAVRIKTEMSEKKERLDEIESELWALSEAYGIKGFRYGTVGFENRGWQTRDGLRKELLVKLFAKYNVPATELEACYQPNETFLDTRITIFDVE